MVYSLIIHLHPGKLYTSLPRFPPHSFSTKKCQWTGVYISKHRDIAKLPGTMTANIRSFTFPLPQELPRIRHRGGLLLIFAEGLDLLRSSFRAFCPHPCGTLGERASWSGGPHGQIPLAQAGSLWHPRAFGFPAALTHQGVVPITLQSHPPPPPGTPQFPGRQTGGCREREQLAKAASSARLTAKELQQIMEIGSLTCYFFFFF